MSVKKTDLCKKFEKYIINDELKKSIRYGIVLNNNYPNDFWNKVIEIFGKHINIKNPVLSIYLLNKYNVILNEKIVTDQENKNMVVDIISILCLSEKNKIKVKKINKEDLLPKNISSKITTKNFNLLNNYIDVNSNQISNYIKIGLNEIAHNIHSAGNIESIIYWVEWLKKQKMDFKITKNISNISEKLSNDWIWVIWDMIFNVKNDSIIRALYKLYKINYKKSERNKRFFIIYFAILLLKNKINKNKIIQSDLNYLRIQMSCDVNYFYKSLNNFFINNKKKEYISEPVINATTNKKSKNENRFLDFIEKNDESFNENKKKKEKEISKKNNNKKDIKQTKKEDKNKIKKEKELQYKNEFALIDNLLNY